jgi:hypothetical protein
MRDSNTNFEWVGCQPFRECGGDGGGGGGGGHVIAMQPNCASFRVFKDFTI